MTTPKEAAAAAFADLEKHAADLPPEFMAMMRALSMAVQATTDEDAAKHAADCIAAANTLSDRAKLETPDDA